MFQDFRHVILGTFYCDKRQTKSRSRVFFLCHTRDFQGYYLVYDHVIHDL